MTLKIAIHPCSAESIQRALTNLRQSNRRKDLRAWTTDLGEHCDSSKVEMLQALLQNETNWKIKNATYLALGKIGGEDAVEWLGQALLNPAIGTQASFLRHSAAEALGTIGTTEAMAQLITALPQDDDFHVRKVMTQQLGTAPDVASADVLLEVLKTDESNVTRKAAAKALSQFGPLVIPSLAEELKAPELKTRYWSFIALAQMESPEAIDALEVSELDVQALLDEADAAKLVEGDRAPTRAVRQAGVLRLKSKPLICKLPWINRLWSRCS